MPENKSNNQENEEFVLDFNNPDYSFVPKGRHMYRQHGYYLICKSCELQHAVFVGQDMLMAGEDEEGNPKMIKRDQQSV